MSSRSEPGAAHDEAAEGRFGVAGESPEGAVSVRSPSREDVFRTVFGLGEGDVRTYDAVADAPGSTTSELADRLGRDRSNVNRSLNRLRETGLVSRDRRLLDEGGHVYQYYAAPTEASEDLVAGAIERWRSEAVDATASE